jgi:hypothetical protein
MKLKKWALMAEIVGAVAIVVSLVFVGLQIRQSNSLAATEALKEGTEIWTDVYRTALGTEESAAFFIGALNDCEQLSPPQRARFFALIAKFLSAYDNIYNQYESGRLREEVFISIALGYYALANAACVQRVMVNDFQNLPPWLLGPDGIAVLTGREADMRLPAFLQQPEGHGGA